MTAQTQEEPLVRFKKALAAEGRAMVEEAKANYREHQRRYMREYLRERRRLAKLAKEGSCE